MKQYFNQLRSMIDSAKTLLTGISINYNSEIGPRTKKLVEITKQIVSIINVDYPEIASILNNAANNIVNRQAVALAPYGPIVNRDFINAYSFADIRTSIRILDTLYAKKTQNGHKLFISHSSKDKEVVSEFCDRILRLGIGISSDDIFCTSIEDMNIKNGDEIRKHIKDNILSADFSFLLISENYKKSEICLNEMGAVWANDNNVRYYLLPNTTFNQIGWLCDTKQAEQLSEHVTLDKLYYELTNYYNIERRIETWSRQRVAFVKNISPGIIESTEKHIKTLPTNLTNNIDESIIKQLKGTPNLSVFELSSSLGLSQKTVVRHLKLLEDSNMIESVGTMHNKKWIIK